MFKKIVGILIYLAIISIYWFRIGGEQTVVLRASAYLIPPFLAVVAGVFTLGLYGLKGSKTPTLLLLTLGMTGWFVGEVLWYIYEFVFHTNPFPSTADVFYLAAYPLLFGAMIYEIRQTSLSWKKIHPSLVFLLVITFLALAVLVSYFGIFLAYDAHETLFVNLIAMGYGIGDLLLITANIFVLILAWEFRGGKLSRVWVTIFIGFIFTLIADILFAIFTDPYKQEVWFYKSLLDSFWMLGYMCFAYALFDFGSTIFSVREKLKHVRLSSSEK